MPSKPPLYTLIVAIAVVAAFGWLSVYMIEAARTLPPQQWDHTVIIFNSIQTMAAAALGVLLGTTVQQARVDAAHSRADAAETKADAAAQDALKAESARKIASGAQSAKLTNDPGATLRAIVATLN